MHNKEEDADKDSEGRMREKLWRRSIDKKNKELAWTIRKWKRRRRRNESSRGSKQNERKSKRERTEKLSWKWSESRKMELRSADSFVSHCLFGQRSLFIKEKHWHPRRLGKQIEKTKRNERREQMFLQQHFQKKQLNSKLQIKKNVWHV